jgi:transcriptional regulator with XRE-family HTH domain
MNLRQLRAARRLTQEQVAERTGLTYRHYQDVEAAARLGLQLATVERLAKMFGVQVWELLVPLNATAARRKRKSRAKRGRAS